MPYVFEINRRTIVLEDGDARAMLTSLVRQTRIQLWARAGGPNSMFVSYLRIYDQHARCHSINLFVQVMEALGGANLPQASFVNRLRRQRTQLSRQLTPRGIGRFYDGYSGFNRDQIRFVNLMKTYQARMIDGAGATIRGLELTRDASFITLGVCATILTAGAASGPVAATASSTSGALLRSAASSFLLSEIRNGATRVGRVMAGERVTLEQTAQEIVNSALNAIPDALLGDIVGRFMGPLTGQLSDFAVREVARGSLLRGVSMELTRNQIEAAVGRAIDYMLGRKPVDIRRMLEAGQNERNARGQANIMSNSLMRNRDFRRFLAGELESVA